MSSTIWRSTKGKIVEKKFVAATYIGNDSNAYSTYTCINSYGDLDYSVIDELPRAGNRSILCIALKVNGHR